jgi:hypothetical protein
MMAETARFEIILPASRRAELEGLAVETGISASALARLAIKRMLNARDELLGHGAAQGGARP